MADYGKVAGSSQDEAIQVIGHRKLRIPCVGDDALPRPA
jgi:hypothetical protein